MTTDRIEPNPAVLQGKPVVRGTRIPVEGILRKLSEGATEADLLAGRSGEAGGRPSSAGRGCRRGRPKFAQANSRPIGYQARHHCPAPRVPRVALFRDIDRFFGTKLA